MLSVTLIILSSYKTLDKILDQEGDGKVEEKFPREIWTDIQEHIGDVAKQYDRVWRKRVRLIGSELLFLFIFKLVLSKNTQGYGSVLVELWDRASEMNLRLPQEDAVVASSICEARSKLPEESFKTLNQQIMEVWKKKLGRGPLWHGHRVFAVDGSKINLPRELLDNDYKTPGDQSYYPQGLVSCLHDLKRAIPYDFDLVSHMNERTCAIKHFDVLERGDVVVFDRGYYSYLLLMAAFVRGILAVFRIPKDFNNDRIKEFWKSSETDKIVAIEPPKDLLSKSKKNPSKIKYNSIDMRLIKYVVEGETYVLGTLLLDERYPASIFPGLYHSRWNIEELYKISKCHIDVEDFHGKSERTVKQELYAHFTLITLARIFECQAEHLLPSSQMRTFANEFQTRSDIEAGNVPSKAKRHVNDLDVEGVFSSNQLELSVGKSEQSGDGATPETTVSGKIEPGIISESSPVLNDKKEKETDHLAIRVKLNFKNCLLVLQRALESLFLLNPVDFLKKKVPVILKAIVRLRQKVRPERSYPRISRKPLKRRKNATPKEVQSGAATAAPG